MTCHTRNAHLSQVFVVVDKLALVTVLQLVRLDVLPQTVDDDRPRLCVHAQQTSEARVELELAWLVVEHEQHRALDILVACALHLEAVCLLRRRGAMPLKHTTVSRCSAT